MCSTKSEKGKSTDKLIQSPRRIVTPLLSWDGCGYNKRMVALRLLSRSSTHWNALLTCLSVPLVRISLARRSCLGHTYVTLFFGEHQHCFRDVSLNLASGQVGRRHEPALGLGRSMITMHGHSVPGKSIKSPRLVAEQMNEGSSEIGTPHKKSYKTKTA